MTEENLMTETKETQKEPSVPAKFLDSETGEVRVDALVKSYQELEKKLSQMMPSVETEEGKARVLKAMGRPDTPEDYCVNCEHGLFEPDAELNKKLFEKGFTQEQVQTVYDAAAEKFVPLIAGMGSDFQAEREIERLTSEFGGAEQWQEVSRQLLSYGRKNLPADVLEGLASSYEGVMALYRMMKGESPSLKVEGQNQEPLTEAQLKTMMRDPKYWKEKDPEFVSKVTQGFEKLY